MALLRVIGFAAAAAAVLGGAVTLYRSDVLPVERVIVEGAVNLTEEEVRAAAAVPAGATLLRVPRGEIEDRLREHVWIEDARVSRSLPDGVKLSITERTPVAYVDTGEATLWLIDGSGFVIESRVPEADDSHVVVRDVPGVEPIAGEVLATPEVENVLALVSGMSEELREMTRAISAPSVDRTALITVDDVEVLIGSVDGLELKDSVARSILAEQRGIAVYVNVRTPDRPTWRGLDTP